MIYGSIDSNPNSQSQALAILLPALLDCNTDHGRSTSAWSCMGTLLLLIKWLELNHTGSTLMASWKLNCDPKAPPINTIVVLILHPLNVTQAPAWVLGSNKFRPQHITHTFIQLFTWLKFPAYHNCHHERNLHISQIKDVMVQFPSRFCINTASSQWYPKRLASKSGVWTSEWLMCRLVVVASDLIPGLLISTHPPSSPLMAKIWTHLPISWTTTDLQLGSEWVCGSLLATTGSLSKWRVRKSNIHIIKSLPSFLSWWMTTSLFAHI